MDYQENPLDRKGGLCSKSLLSLNMNLCVIYCLSNKKIVLIALFVRTDLLRFLYETLAPLSKNKKDDFTTATPLLTPLTQPWLVLSLLCLHYVLLRSLKLDTSVDFGNKLADSLSLCELSHNLDYSPESFGENWLLSAKFLLFKCTWQHRRSV